MALSKAKERIRISMIVKHTKTKMKTSHKLNYLLLLATIISGMDRPSVHAATPEQEKAFVESYKKALEAGDTKALAAFLSTEGADAEIVGMFKMTQALEEGSKIDSITLVGLEKEEIEKMTKAMPGPDGKLLKLSVKPYKKLVIKTSTKSPDLTTSGSSESPVAEIKGKLLIPVPVATK
jgi:hypothetical protein